MHERLSRMTARRLRMGAALPLSLICIAVALHAVAGASPYGLRVLTVAGIYALAVLGYQIIFGQAGALSLAQGTFFGIGAYVTGILGSRYGFDFPASFTLSILIPTLVAMAIAVPVMRLESHYFALATLGIGQVVLLLAVNWQDFTGGANGIAGVPGVTLFGHTVPRGLPLAAFVWGWVIVGVLVARWFGRGVHGIAFAALRDNPLAARTLGLDVDRLRFTALAVSAAYAGAAGALSVHTQRVVSPEVLEFPIMVSILTMAVVGGRGRIWGAVVGALLLVHLPEWFRGLERGYLLVYGIALLAAIVIAPDGIVGALDGLCRKVVSAFGSPPSARPPSARPPSNRTSPASVLSAPPAPSTLMGDGIPFVRLSNLSKSFGGVRAVDRVSLDLGGGRIIGLIGPNGSGKTTLVNLVTGLETIGSGRLTVAGRDMTRAAAHVIARAGVARTFQTPGLPMDLTVLDAVATARIAAPARDGRLERARDRAWEFLDRLGLGPLAGRACGALPAGTRRLVDVARAMAREPQLLLLDEPAAGLTEDEQARLARCLRRLAQDQGVTVVVVEHNMHFLAPLADRLICLDEGRVIAAGTPAEVGRDPVVLAAYLGEPLAQGRS